MKQYARVLSIAGSDSGGGAGIQADIKAISACGGYAMTAVTAITVQNTVGVRDVFPLPVDTVTAQIGAVAEDLGVDAVKIGMLHSAPLIVGVSETLRKYGLRNVVLDPVMVATSGDRLIQEEAVDSLRATLLQSARVITPNIPEAALLLGKDITGQDQLPACAKELSGGKVSVLLKAGHLHEEALTDVFYNAETGETHCFTHPRLQTRNTHGTGCTLSSALAAFLAGGLPLDRAVEKACDYVHEAIRHGSDYELGKGHGPVAHFYRFWS